MNLVSTMKRRKRPTSQLIGTLFFTALLAGCSNSVGDPAVLDESSLDSGKAYTVVLSLDDSNSAYGVANVKRFFESGEEATLMWTCGEDSLLKLRNLFVESSLTVPMGTIAEQGFNERWVNPSQITIISDTKQVLAVSNKVVVSKQTGGRCSIEYTFPKVNLDESPFAVDLTYWGNDVTWFNYSDDLASGVTIPIQMLRQTVK